MFYFYPGWVIFDAVVIGATTMVLRYLFISSGEMMVHGLVKFKSKSGLRNINVYWAVAIFSIAANSFALAIDSSSMSKSS